jgi:formylglycine-generating enzyme required for sulfatase activity/uncharacterized caspase-like protein
MKTILLALLFALPAAAADRVALIIGNTIYDPAKPKGSAPNLITADNDAKALAALLEKTLAFKVILKTDAGLNDMADAVEEFKAEAASAKVVLVFYAGHGIESAALGDNFLLPVQAKLVKEAHLKTEAYPLKTLLSDVQQLSATTRLVILDCCRNNPLEGRAWYAERPQNENGRGLAAVDSKALDQSTMVVFSAAPGKPAKDRLLTTDLHSPFAEVLMAKLMESGKSCAQIFGEVEEAVFVKTSEQQRPKTFLNGNLAPFTTFAFRPGGGSPQPDAAMAARLAKAEQELAAMKKAATMVDPRQPGKSDTPSAATAFTNSLGMKFVPVPGTDVLFCIHETRSRDFAVFMADRNRGYTMSGDDAEKWRTYEYKKVPVGRGAGEQAEQSNHPVANVSWHDAVAFCDWLSRKEVKAYRLPTDREWSLAVGILQEGNGTPKALDSKIAAVYPWDGSLVAASIQGNYADSAAEAKGIGFGYINGYRDGFPTTSPVMSFAANEFGLHDMGGNLFEWCAGCYDGTDPAGKDRSLTGSRVVRGGSWINDDSASLLSSYRNYGHPAYRRDYYGFRVVVGGAGG